MSAISRRVFLQSVSACGGAALLDHGLKGSQTADLEPIFAELRANLLEMINEERLVEKVPALAIDELAQQVATRHAIDMATGEFVSPWGRAGLKPYHRYSFAGGTHATQENVSAANNTWSMKSQDLKQDTSYLHVRLYQETPPNDAHRKAILASQHTHVGFGLAVEKLRLRLVELFVAKHVEVSPISRNAKPGAQFSFAGKMLRAEYTLNLVEVFYEPLPTAPELSWLQQRRSYSLPADSRVLRPKLKPPLIYADRSKGEVEVTPDGGFRAPIKLFNDEPGIYTIVTWIRRSKSEKAFPATEVCVRVDD